MLNSRRYWLVLAVYLSLAIEVTAGSLHLFNDSISSESDTLLLRARIRELYTNNLTLLRNEKNIIPLKESSVNRIAAVSINKTGITRFQKMISAYRPADFYTIDPQEKGNNIAGKISGSDLVIAGVYSTGNMESDDLFKLDSLISSFTVNRNVIVVWFGDPASAGTLPSLKKCNGLIIAYSDNRYTEELSAQLIFGGTGASGRLPVRVNQEWNAGFGLTTQGNLRLQFGFPENAGIASELLETRIDSLVKIGLDEKAFPGCEVMIARKGIVIFHKCYGFHTYDTITPVVMSDIFDLASVTKVSATLAGLMLLESKGMFSTEGTLGSYMPFYRWSNKRNLRMEEILTHQAGLTSWIPFWKETANKKGELRKRFYDQTFSEKYPYNVIDTLYIKKNYPKKIFREIRRSPVGEKKYLYSDLGFIISPGIIEQLTGEKWYEYVTNNIYHKIGAYDIGFNPHSKYPPERIIPTEYDSLFRKQLIHGYVHDEGAAMLNGISGHAGLFSTAGDLMKLVEMYRRMGTYGGEEIISKNVLEKYTRVRFPENNNRRGLGFDKPLLNNYELPQDKTYPTGSVSPSSFGHSGFTGTFVWADPDYEISYLFLSNRVYPTRNNNKLSELNIRTLILQAIYDSIIE
jgi:CubicO group peptidase (beta-lactamase class C family)